MPKSKSRFERFREQAENLWNEKLLRAGDEPTRLYRFLHFWVLVIKSFIRNRCPVRASALSYSTLLALIPMLAVALGVTSSLLKDEGEARIERFIEHIVTRVVPPANTDSNVINRTFEKPVTPLPGSANEPSFNAGTNARANVAASSDAAVSNLASFAEGATNGAPQSTNVLAAVATVVAESAAEGETTRMAAAQRTAAREINNFIQRTRSGTLGITGTILLIVVAIRMLSQIEETFNDIWGVTCGRSWPMRIIIYWTTITLGPLLLASALGLSGSAHLKASQELITDMPIVGRFFIPGVTLVLIWIAFAMFYKAVPNTRVSMRAAMVGGMVAGTA